MRAYRSSNDEFYLILKETTLKIQLKMKPFLEEIVEQQLIILKKV